MNDVDIEYSARNAYSNYSNAINYEKARFSGILGRYRWKLEQTAIKELVECIPENVVICDIPCGTGRFWKILAEKATKIIAMDISDGMLTYAKERAFKEGNNIVIQKGDATNIPLEDNSVDFVFSHALTKHLPIPLQQKVLSEYSRISRIGVICSFGIFTHLTYEFWRRRKLIESYPVLIEELNWMAKSCNLKIEKKVKCTTLIGVEHVVLFLKLNKNDIRNIDDKSDEY